MSENASVSGITRLAAPLVGRRSEIHWLEECLDASVRGEPRVVLLQGEAGIGKSRLARELEDRARQRGIRVCHARCDERMAFAYSAFQDTLFPILREFGDAADESSDAILPSFLAGAKGGSALAEDEVGDHETAVRQRAQLLSALTHQAISLARRAPLLLVVDDLAWADDASFDLIQQLAMRTTTIEPTESVQLMILLTSRPDLEQLRQSDVDRLMRERICSIVELVGLDALETAEFLREYGLGSVSRDLIEQARRTTSGNPLFLETASRRILARRRLEEIAALELSPAALSDLALPAELEDVVAEQLEQLSTETLMVLRHAAVMGRTVSLEPLCRLVEISTEALDDAVEEALLQAVIEVEGDFIAFRHPLYQTYLYQTTSPARRRRIHRDVARQLADEDTGDRVHGAELADQLIRAGSEVSPRPVARACIRAADQAARVFAWGEAARFYKAGLEAGDRAPGEFAEAERAALLFAGGIACDVSMDGESASHFFAQAIEVFEHLDDPRGVVRAAIASARCALGHRLRGESAERWAAMTSRLTHAIEGLDPEEGVLISLGLATVATLHFSRGDFDRSTEVAHRAEVASREAVDSLGVVRATIAGALPSMARLELHRCLGKLEEARRVAITHGDRALLCEASNRQPLVRLWLGQLREAEDRAREALALSREVNDPIRMVAPLAALTVSAVARGDAVAAEQAAYQAGLIQRFSSYLWVNGLLHPALASLQIRRGAWAEAERTLSLCSEGGGQAWSLPPIARWFCEMYLRAKSGDLEGVRREIADHPKRSAVQPVAFLGPAGFSCVLIELAELLEMPHLAEAPVRVLEEAAKRGQVFTSNLLFHIPRMLGKGALLLGDRSLAVTRLEAAVEDAWRVGALCDRALGQLDLARALDIEDAEDAARAAAIARTGRNEVAALGLAAELPMADELVARLDQVAAASVLPTSVMPPPEGALTIMFTDIGGSTSLVERLGDLRARDVIGVHNEIVRKQLVKWGGYEVEQQGDGFLVAFGGARNAVRCSIGIQQDLARLEAAGKDEVIRVRIGMHTGEAIRDGVKLFGLSVILASRIANQAVPGEILISSTVNEAAREMEDVRLGVERKVGLRGITEQQTVFDVEWRRGT